MGVGSSHQASSNSSHGPKTGGVKPINHADYKQFGLENVSHRPFYANSVLQALYFCQPFRELVCDSHDKKAPSPAAPSGPIIPATPPTLFSALRSLFLHIALNPADKGTVSPTSFITKVKKENELFRSTMHQDAHEFLGFLLNKIVEDLETEMKSNIEMGGDDCTQQGQPNKTFVHTLFEGTLTSETRCLTCETVSSRDESFLDLSIDIEQNSSVTACLRQFSASEMLAQRNKFFCDTCGGLQEAEKRMKIKKLPNVLALHLKRFKYQEDVQKYIKLSYRVAFPFELRLFNTVDDAPDPDRLYRLFAIVVHIGGGPHHGHYITIVRAHGTWFVFDDDNVEPIREADIPKYFGDSPGGSGYVLFYQAVDLDLASVGIDSDQDAGPVVEVEADPKTFGNGVNHHMVSVTPASMSTPANQLKLDIPTVIEPDLPSATPTAAPATVSTIAMSSISPSHMSSHATSILPNTNNSAASVSPVSAGLTLKHLQSVKLNGNINKELHTRQSSIGQGAADSNGNTNGDTIPSIPEPVVAPETLLTHSKSLKGKEKDRESAISGRWFSRKRDKKDKRPSTSVPVPVPPLSSAVIDVPVRPSSLNIADDVPSLPARKPLMASTDEEADPPLSSRSSQPPRSSVSELSIALSSGHVSSSALSEPSLSATLPPSPAPPPPTRPPPGSFPKDTLSVVITPPTKVISRPATSPSSLSSPSLPLPDMHPEEPPPVPDLPIPPPSPITSPRTRKASQVFPPPSPSPNTLERPNTAGAKAQKRASRKMSLSAMPLAAMFGRKDKDKDHVEKDKPPPTPLRSIGRAQSAMISGSHPVS
ncbi:cysteine proteinase [Ramaria rubella]|nr:cysteine proteinase [Ramaria rubella]